jgi:endo-beta-N-acetylglucosaminidase D
LAAVAPSMMKTMIGSGTAFRELDLVDTMVQWSGLCAHGLVATPGLDTDSVGSGSV